MHVIVRCHADAAGLDNVEAPPLPSGTSVSKSKAVQLFMGAVSTTLDMQPRKPCWGITDTHIVIAELCRLQAGVAPQFNWGPCPAVGRLRSWKHCWGRTSCEQQR